MLKVITLFEVSVLLNNNQKFSCILASPPTVEALREAAATEKAPVEVVEALCFFRDIKLPAEDKDKWNPEGIITEITIAGAVLGSIRVSPFTAYRQPNKRGPKEPADNADAAVATLAAVADKAAVKAAAADMAAAAVKATAAVEAAVDKAAVDKAAVDKAAVDKAAVDKAAVDKAIGGKAIGGKRGPKKPADNATATATATK